MAREKIRWGSDEGIESGFKAIVEFEGDVVDMRVVNGAEIFKGQGADKDLVVVDCENVEILEVLGDADVPDLTDDKFSFNIPYAAVGQEPRANGIYMKNFAPSAEKLGLTMPVTEGRYVFRIMERKFGSSDDGQNFTARRFMFKEVAGGGGAGDSDDYLRELLVGVKPAAARRVLMMDSKAKKMTDVVGKLKSGELIEELGLEVGEDGTYVEIV